MPARRARPASPATARRSIGRRRAGGAGRRRAASSTPSRAATTVSAGCRRRAGRARTCAYHLDEVGAPPAIAAASPSSRVAATRELEPGEHQLGARQPPAEERAGLPDGSLDAVGSLGGEASGQGRHVSDQLVGDVLGDGPLECRPAAEVRRGAALGQSCLPVDAAVGQPLEAVPGQHDDGRVEDLARRGDGAAGNGPPRVSDDTTAALVAGRRRGVASTNVESHEMEKGPGMTFQRASRHRPVRHRVLRGRRRRDRGHGCRRHRLPRGQPPQCAWLATSRSRRTTEGCTSPTEPRPPTAARIHGTTP